MPLNPGLVEAGSALYAKERAGIPVGKRVPVFILPRLKKFSLPMLPFNLPIPGAVGRSWTRLLMMEALADSSILAMMPFQLMIK